MTSQLCSDVAGGPGSVPSKRWSQLSHLSPAPAEAWQRTMENIAVRYGEPQRHYHNITHIADLLTLSRDYADALIDRDAVDLAIFYHDAIYDAARGDNEALSAVLARQQLSGLGLAGATVRKVAAYIEATKHAAVEPAGDKDLDYFLDFDLSILAAEPARYADYCAAIRREYSSYPDQIYAAGRFRVLRGFLARPHIYRVDALAAAWELCARKNISTEIALLCP